MENTENTNKHLLLNEIYTLIYDIHNHGAPFHYSDLFATALLWMYDNLERDDFDILFDFLYGVSLFEGRSLTKQFDVIFNRRKSYPMYEHTNSCFLKQYGLESRDYERGMRKSMIIPFKHFRLDKNCLFESMLNNCVMERGTSDKLFSAYRNLCNKYKGFEACCEDKDSLLNICGVPERYRKVCPASSETLYRMVKFYDAYGRVSGTVTDLNHISVYKCDDFGGMFSSTNHFLNTDAEGKNKIFRFINRTKWVYDIGTWDVSHVKDMRNVFRYADYIPKCISRWNVENVGSFSGAFRGVKRIPDISSWNTQNCFDMCEMFHSADNIPDISKWFVGNVHQMAYMFYNTGYIPDISMWDVSNVYAMEFMFSNSRLTADLSRWNVSNVTSFLGMFKNSIFAVDTDFTDWNVSQAVEFSGMFQNSSGHLWVECSTKGRRSGLSGMLRNCVPIFIDISAWDVSGAMYMDSMFEGSDFATDLSRWNVSNVKYAKRFDVNCECSHKNPFFNEGTCL